MKNTLILLSFLVLSCQNKKEKLVVASNGNINTISVVMSDALWESDPGRVLRDVFAFPAEGLPQQEPRFDLKQIPPEVFSGFARSSRNIIWAGISNQTVIRTDQNAYATPQIMGVFSSESKEGLVEMLLSQSESLIKQINQNEINERQRRIRKSVLKRTGLEDQLGITLSMPSAYQMVKREDNTVWFQREIQKGHINLLVYELPLQTILNKSDPLQTIITIRDSVGKAFVPGRLPNTYMITEEAYEPYWYTTEINGMKGIETRGTWEVKNDFMAGPFLNYLLMDDKNKRMIVLDGFVFAPSVNKRDYIFEIEAIIKSLSLKV